MAAGPHEMGIQSVCESISRQNHPGMAHRSVIGVGIEEHEILRSQFYFDIFGPDNTLGSW